MSIQSRVPPALGWLPEDKRRAYPVRAGVNWDAVRVPLGRGDDVLRLLGERCGAVIEDSWSAQLYVLIAPGSADGWKVSELRGIQIIGANAFVTVPGLLCVGNPHWRVRPTDVEDWLTDTEQLRDALRSPA